MISKEVLFKAFEKFGFLPNSPKTDLHLEGALALLNTINVDDDIFRRCFYDYVKEWAKWPSHLDILEKSLPPVTEYTRVHVFCTDACLDLSDKQKEEIAIIREWCYDKFDCKMPPAGHDLQMMSKQRYDELISNQSKAVQSFYWKVRGKEINYHSMMGNITLLENNTNILE